MHYFRDGIETIVRGLWYDLLCLFGNHNWYPRDQGNDYCGRCAKDK